MPGFRELLLAVSHAWTNDRARMLENGQQLLEHIGSTAGPQAAASAATTTAALQPSTLDQAAAALAQNYDWAHGGWGRAPKFPQPMAIAFLLRRATRGDVFARDLAVHALRAMAKGGMYDVIGGGFARYATDDHWRIPHFEKMLYDNAQLALAYLHAWLLTHEAHFRQVCEETLDFVLREMTHPAGGFTSSLDADSEGEEGKFYAWTPDEVRAALPDAHDCAFFTAAYPVTQAGNFEGKNILQRALSDEQLAEQFQRPVADIAASLRALHQRLLVVRARRVRPSTDDKVLTAWNALMLTAFAEAGRYLQRADYLTAAQRNARFLLDNLFEQGRLLRSWRAGRARHSAYLEDYAALCLALLSLYQSDPAPRWFEAAQRLADDMLAHFADPAGGFFDTRDDHESLITRPKDLQDNATPCGNSLAALALRQLAAYTGEDRYRSRAEAAISLMQPLAERYPTAFAHWLCALDFALGPVQEVVIVGAADEPATLALTRTLWEAYRPRLVAAHITGDAPLDTPPLVAGRTLHQNQPAAYVCAQFVCQRPVQTAEALRKVLA
jgi:uncharacterized protein YyaL (SSP411 family)